MPAAVVVEGLSKRYRIGELQAAYGTLRESMSHAAKRLTGREHRHHHEEIWALEDVSFDLEEGEALGIIGRNGASRRCSRSSRGSRRRPAGAPRSAGASGACSRSAPACTPSSPAARTST